MNDEQKQLFHQYEEAKRKAKEAQDVIDLLKPQLIELLPADAKVDTGTAQIYWKKGRAKWTFSESLQSDIEKIEERKEVEIQEGVAKKEEGTPYIECKIKK